MHLLRLSLPAVLAFAACAGDPALERQYQALEREQAKLREEMGSALSSADRLFQEATNAQRQTRNSVSAAARCSAPKTAFRPSGPLAFGPVRFKYKEKTFFYAEGAPFDTPAWHCVQESESAR